MKEIFATEVVKEREKKFFSLPISEWRNLARDNLVFKEGLNMVVDTCRLYAEILRKESYSSDGDAFSRVVTDLYERDRSIHNNFSNAVVSLIRLFGMAGINHVDVLKRLQTREDYAHCALETYKIL